MPDTTTDAELLPHQTTVRLTLRPDEDTVVNKDEVHNLRHQGLLIEDEPASATAAADGPAADGAAAGGQPGTGGADGSGATADGKKAKAPQPPA